MIRKLKHHQIHDQKGSFLVGVEFTGKRTHDGKPIMIAPARRDRDGTLTTYTNTIQFVPVK